MKGWHALEAALLPNALIQRRQAAHRRDSPQNRGIMDAKPSSAAAPRALEVDHHVRDDHAEGGAALIADQRDLATMGVDELGGDCEPKPGAVLPRHALKRLEEMRLRPLRHSRPGVAYVDHRDCAFAPRDDDDLAVAVAPALQRLHAVAAEIAQHAKELVAVGVDLEVGRDVEDPLDAIGARQPKSIANLGDERGKLELSAPRRHFLRLAEIERAGAKPDGAVERGEQLRHELLHALILYAAKAIGEELRARQHVAQIVADLAHRQAKGSEPILLAQHAGKLGLHGGKLALGGADLVAAPRRRDDARRVLRALAEAHHVP